MIDIASGVNGPGENFAFRNVIKLSARRNDRTFTLFSRFHRRNIDTETKKKKVKMNTLKYTHKIL